MDIEGNSPARMNRARALGLATGISAISFALISSFASPGRSAAAEQNVPASEAVEVTIAAGMGAKLLCSSLFLSGRTQEDVIKADILPLSPLAQLLSFEVDRNVGAVTALADEVKRTAIYRDGRGCALDDVRSKGDERSSKPLAIPTATVETVAAKGPLADAMVSAEADPSKLLRTRAIVVLQHGRIVAEHYADGISPTMPLLGWSMSKSVTAALAGLVVGDGLLRLDDPVNAPEWPDGDPRREITLRQLLQMTSGLAFVEDYTVGNDSTRMLFTEPDMAAYAARQPAEAAPGSVWSYSSGSTNIAARALVTALGGSVAAQDYMRRRLFEPAGMTSVTFEEDAAGTPVGSSYVYATARDWARFGQLFLDRGQVDGQTVLTSDWVDFVSTPAPAAKNGGYGGSFWLNGRADGGAGKQFPHLPDDAFFAMGHNGQVVAIFPSHDVVIVRLGWTTGDAEFDIDRVFSGILEALPQQ